MSFERHVISTMWDRLQTYVSNDLALQDIDLGEKEVGDEFEKLVQSWIFPIVHTLRLTYSMKKGLSGIKHQFDLIAAIPEDAKVGNGLLFECKTLWLRRLLEKKKLSADDVNSLLLSRDPLMTFLIKSYDTFPEEFFGTMTLEKVYPVVVSTKPLSRDAFKFALIYGITVLQPSKESFMSFLKKASEHLAIEVGDDFVSEISERGSYHLPHYVLQNKLEILADKLSSSDRKEPFDLYRVRARKDELVRFSRQIARKVGTWPQRSKADMGTYESIIYERYLDHAREVGALEYELVHKYDFKI